MKCRAIIEELEKIAPISYAEQWDNVGLLVGSQENEVNKIMLALDATDQVVEQAVKEKADLLITHHPMIFSGLKRVTDQDLIGRRIIQLVQNNISYYAMHTNCDICVMNKEAADKIGIIHSEILEPTKENPDTKEMEGIGRCGFLEEACTVEALARMTKEAFGLSHVRIVGNKDKKVNRVAISTGSGKSMIPYALKAKAEVLITGDIDHHNAIDALDQGLMIVDAGHFGTEHFMTESIQTYLKEKFGTEIHFVIAKEESPFTIIS